MAIRHPEAAAESWTGFSPQDDRDEAERPPGDHHLPFATERSPRPHAICLALSAMRPGVPTPATDDSAASAPLRHLSGITTRIGIGEADSPGASSYTSSSPLAASPIVLYLLAGC